MVNTVEIITEITRKLWYYVGSVIEALQRLLMNIFGYGKEQSHGVHTAEETIIRADGGVEAWDEWFLQSPQDAHIANQLDDEDNEPNRNVVKRAVVYKRGDKPLHIINTSNNAIPHQESVNVTKVSQLKVHSTEATAYVVPTVYTPIGTVKVYTNAHVSEMTLEELKSVFQVNPELYMDRKIKNRVTVYGNNYIDKTCTLLVKKINSDKDLMVTTRVYSVADITIVTKGKPKKETLHIVLKIKEEDGALWIGALAKVQRMPFICTRALPHAQSGTIYLVCASLLVTDIQIDILLKNLK